MNEITEHLSSMKMDFKFQSSAALWVNFDPSISRQRPKDFSFFNDFIFTNTRWIVDYIYTKMWTYESKQTTNRASRPRLDVAKNDTFGVFFAEIVALEAQHVCASVLSAGGALWLSVCLSKAAAAGSRGAAAHLPHSAWNIPQLLLFLLRSSCPRSRLVKVICHPAVQQSYGWTMLFPWFLSWLSRRCRNSGCFFLHRRRVFVPCLPVGLGNSWASVEGAAPWWELPSQVLFFCLCC